MPVGERIDIANHPELEKALPDYKGIIDFLEGSTVDLGQYLTKYEAEQAKTKEALNHYVMRLNRLYHKPIMEPSHQIHVAHLSQKVKWGSIEDSAIKDFLLDVTGKQESADDFLSEILAMRLALGRVGVLVDSPKKVNPLETRAEVREGGNRSYQILYRADQIKFWEFARAGARKGQLTKVVLYDEPEYTEAGKKLERLRRFFYRTSEATNFTWQILREADNQVKSTVGPNMPQGKWEVVEENEGELSKIPFVMWGEGLKHSLFRKVWQLEKANLNNNSSKSNIIYRQGFQRIIVAGAKDNELQKVGESIINKLQNQDAKVYTIDAGSPDAAFQEEGLIESRAQRIALLQHNQLVDDTKQVQSAESKEKDLIAREKYYTKILDQAERKLKDIWSLHFEFEGIEGADSIEISIVRDFGLKSAELEMRERSNLTFLAKQANVPSVIKEVLKTEISRANFTVTDDETEKELKERLYAEVDSAEEVIEEPQVPGVNPGKRGETIKPNAAKQK